MANKIVFIKMNSTNANESESENNCLEFHNQNSTSTDKNINDDASIIEYETPLKKVKHNDEDKKIIEKSDGEDTDDQVGNLQKAVCADEENSVSPSLTTTSTSLTKLKPCEDPVYKKPFDFGWKRELVLRAHPNSKDKGNIYYITPNNIKLKSRNEIQSHLTPGLSLKNFTFNKNPLNANPEHEKVRVAKPMSKHTTSIAEVIPKNGANPPQERWTPGKIAADGRFLTTGCSTAATTVNTTEVAGVHKAVAVIPTKKKIDSSSFHEESQKRSGVESNNSIAQKVIKVDNFATNFVNVPLGYDVLVIIFQYLNFQERQRAASICRLWNEVANCRTVWKTVRLDNYHVKNWNRLAALLLRNETKHLDLRKQEMWDKFAKLIQTVVTLKQIDLGYCPPGVLHQLFKCRSKLVIINAPNLKGSNSVNLKNIYKMKNLEELRLHTFYGGYLTSELDGFEYLTKLCHLSLTHIKNLSDKNCDVFGNLINLKSLELGHCSNYTNKFAENVLQKLKNLERLRLEQYTNIEVTCKILQVVSKLPKLNQLELINFTIGYGFEENIELCENIKRLLLIPTPTYYSQHSAMTNNVILRSITQLGNTLESFIWVVTTESLRATSSYAAQVDPRIKKRTYKNILVLDPHILEIKILPLTKMEEMLTEVIPNGKHKILKMPHRLTWNQKFIPL